MTEECQEGGHRACPRITIDGFDCGCACHDGDGDEPRLTALAALRAIGGAEAARLYSPSFHRVLQTLEAREAWPRVRPGAGPPLTGMQNLAICVLSLCVTLDEERARAIRLAQRSLRPLIVCTDPAHCPKGDTER